MAGQRHVIIGMAETGLSYARYLAGLGVRDVLVMDDVQSVGRQAAFSALLPDAEFGPIEEAPLVDAAGVYVSPGVPLATPAIANARRAGAAIHGDIEMFGDLKDAPAVLVTGTNGKSTVVTLIQQILSTGMDDVRLGGNVGTPCLDVLVNQADSYVLEASSYQLELATNFPAEVAVLLNLAPDHLDRYETLEDYYATKRAVYNNCRKAVVNREIDPALQAQVNAEKVISIGLDEPRHQHDIGMRDTAVCQGDEVLFNSADLNIAGEHNLLNVMAAVAVGLLMDISPATMLPAVRAFKGLDHRGQRVAESRGISFINDSKATNPGAMLAAVTGFAEGKNVRLIAGGDAKGLSFNEVAPALAANVSAAYLIGKNRDNIRAALSRFVTVIDCEDLGHATAAAYQDAKDGDVVLLAPGCASFDEFRNYIQRGEAFVDAVREMIR